LSSFFLLVECCGLTAEQRVVASQKSVAHPPAANHQIEMLPGYPEASGDCGLRIWLPPTSLFAVRSHASDLVLKSNTSQYRMHASARHFSRNLRVLRGELSQQEFSKLLGLNNQVTYHRYENGRLPRPKILSQIAGILGITKEEICSPMPLGKVAEVVKRLNLNTAPRPTDDRYNISVMLAAFHDPEFQRQMLLDSEIHLPDEAYETGRLKVALAYLGGKPPDGFPESITLTRPPTLKATGMLPELLATRKIEAVLLACLAPEHQREDFLNRLAPMHVVAMARAAIRLTYGKSDSERILAAVSYSLNPK
jgi:transcriptional regulator with XRE-family HTH domain